MKTRKTQMMKHSSGNGYIKYAVNIPVEWAKALTRDSDNLELSFDGQRIIVKSKVPDTVEEFKQDAQACGHRTDIYQFGKGDVLCSTLYVDSENKSVLAVNGDVPLIDTAFGQNTSPSWEDFNNFLEERCVPRNRNGLEYYLSRLNIEEYDARKIILLTDGRTAEDNRWLRIISQ